MPFLTPYCSQSGRQGICAHKTYAEFKAGRYRTSSEAARADAGWEGCWAVRVRVMRQDQCLLTPDCPLGGQNGSPVEHDLC